jgi:hypothetical protein
MSDPSELILTAIALGAVLVAFAGIALQSKPSTVAQRLQILYGLLSAFFALRLSQIISPNATFNGTILLVGAWLPFAQLRLGEEIVRFHAPRLVKIGTLGGAICFSVLTTFGGLLPGQSILIGLALFQFLTFASVIFLLIKHRSDVSTMDRSVADTFVLALLISVPLAMTDFRELIPNTPVRGGAFGMLIMVLATSHFAVSGGSPRALMKDIAITLFGGGIIALMIIWSGLNLSQPDIVKVAACAVATTSLAILIERFTSGQNSKTDIMGAIAKTVNMQDRSSLISAHPVLSHGKVLDSLALADYPKDTLALLLQHQILTRATGMPATRDATRDLLDRFAASHLLRICTSPPQFLAISAGDLAGPSLDDELTVVARLIEAAN